MRLAISFYYAKLRAAARLKCNLTPSERMSSLFQRNKTFRGMVCGSLFCSAGLMGLSAKGDCAFVPSTTVVADFESTDPAAITRTQDTNVSGSVVQIEKNGLDGSRALRFTTDLTGLGAGWAGCSLPVKSGAALPAGADAVTFDARSPKANSGLFVTLTESDGSRWNANVRLTGDWKHYRVPVGSFTPFTVAKGREGSRPRVQNIVSIDPWVGNALQGLNGFDLDYVAITDDQPAFVLRCVSETSIPLQRTTTVLLEASETTGGVPSSFQGELWLDVMDRNNAIVPEKVSMRNGKASAEIFARHSGPLDLYVYEPESRSESIIPLTVMDGMRTELSFNGFDGQQLIFANQILVPKLKLEGSGQLPLTVHIKVKDHNGRTIVSQFESVSALAAGKGRVAIPSAGLMSVDVKALAQPLGSFPHLPDNLPVPIPTRPEEEPTTSVAVALPEGLTTTAVIGSVVTLEDIPATATVVGEDRFTVWAITISPSELVLYNSPFGICSGGLFHLDLNQIATVGRRRLNWHRKLGSFWGRNDMWWDQSEPARGVFNWEKSNMVVNAYQEHDLTFLGILCYASKWSNGVAPADDEGRKEWREWIAELFKQFEGKFKAFEVWNEPNHGFWGPRPDADAYRKLVKTTYEQLRSTQARPRVVAGATAGFDPPFLEQLMLDGYGNYWDALSLHPYPENPGKSPEDNSLPETCAGVRNLMRKNGVLAKECWFTELGWPSGPEGVSEMDQANYLVRAYTIARYYDINKIFWFDLCDWTRMPWVGEAGAHNGLIDSNFRPKPAATAYNLMSFMLNQLTPKEVLTQGKATIYSFGVKLQSVKWPGAVYVAWTPRAGEEQDVELTMTAGGAVFAFDYLGAEQKPVVLSETPMPLSSELQETTAAQSGKKDSHELHNEPRPMKRVCRFHITNEPLYIWESIIPPKPHDHDD